MNTTPIIQYEFENQLELNHAFMSFIKNGGIFIPMENITHSLGDDVTLRIRIPGHTEYDQIRAKVIWITPDNAINHIYSGVGLQLMGDTAPAVLEKITANLDNSVDTGGYVYGVSHDTSV